MCFVAAFLLARLLGFVFCIRYGGDDDGIATNFVKSSAQAIDHAAMLLLPRQDHSKPNMVAAPDIGWMASSAMLLVAGSLFVFVVFLALSCRHASLCVSIFFFPVLFFLLSSWCFPFFSCFLQIELVCWLACFVFFSRARCGWYCIAKSPRCICNVYICLVVCGHRARLSWRRHRRAHCLCWM